MRTTPARRLRRPPERTLPGRHSPSAAARPPSRAAAGRLPFAFGGFRGRRCGAQWLRTRPASSTGGDDTVELHDYRLAGLDSLPTGSQFEWEAIGKGEALLWIEGGPGFPAHLARPDAELLARWFTVHLVNAPGCGRTTAPTDPRGYDLDHLVAFFDSVRRALDMGPVTVAGHSWGALVAVAFAAKIPDAVLRLILIDGYLGEGSVSPADAAAERDRAFDRVRDRPWFGVAHRALETTFGLQSPSEQQAVDTFVPAWPLYFADPESPASRTHIERLTRELRFNVDAAAAWGDTLEATDYRPLAMSVTCPTLIIVGEHDFICGPVWNRAMSRAIPGSRYAEIAGVGHLPQYEAPEEFASIVDSWLARDRTIQLPMSPE